MDPAYGWNISAAGSSAVTLPCDVVREKVSYAQGVNPQRNTCDSDDTQTTGGRRLNTTYTRAFTGLTLPNRAVTTPSTFTIASLGAPDVAWLTSELNAYSTAFDVTSAYTPVAYSNPQASVNWTTQPDESSTTTNSVTISFASDNAHGEISCVVVDDYPAGSNNNNLKPTQQQVWLGLDANNEAALSAKTIDASDGTTAATEITLDGLARGTTYHAFCTATNGAPVWPGFVTYSSLDNFLPIEFTTDGEADEDDDDDDSALLTSSNIVALCTMLAALIFN